MPKLNWNGNDFRNNQDSSGTVADNISRKGKLQQGYEHGSLTKGLVAYYPMEKGQGEILHDGAFDNLGQIEPGSSGENTSVSDMWVSGEVGSNALQFNGSDDRVIIQGTDTFDFGDKSFTISAWVKTTESSDMHIFSKIDYPNRNGYALRSDENSGGWKATLEYYDSSGTNYKLAHSDTSIDDGEWHHVAVTYDHMSDEGSIHLDGIKEDSGTPSDGPSDSSIEPSIGGETGGLDRWWNGQIDDVRIYNRTLPLPEIQALANNTKTSGIKRTEKNVPGQKQGGISRYKLNGNADDFLGYNNGTFYGDTPKYDTGVYGQAGKFNGTNNYIKIGSPLGLDFTASDQFTVSQWVNTNDLSSNRQHIISTRSGNNNWISILTFTDGTLAFYCSGDSNSNNVSHEITSDKWYHVLGTYKENSVKLYINGSLVGEDSSSTLSGSFLGGDDWEIGRRQNSTYRRWYNGKIDDVRIYDKALTPLQVEKLYHKGAYRIPRESTLQ